MICKVDFLRIRFVCIPTTIHYLRIVLKLSYMSYCCVFPVNGVEVADASCNLTNLFQFLSVCFSLYCVLECWSWLVDRKRPLSLLFALLPQFLLLKFGWHFGEAEFVVFLWFCILYMKKYIELSVISFECKLI